MTTQRSKRARWGIAAGAIALVLGGAAFLPATTWAADQSAQQATGSAAEQTPTSPTNPRADQLSAFAEALGITVDELQAAQKEAANAALDQAVTDGLLTQRQADAMRQRLDSAVFPFALGMGRHAMRGFGDGEIDFDALLATALGVTTDDLAAARDKVFAGQLSQAVTDGKITQEQADLIQARRDLGAFVQPQLEAARDKALADAVSQGIVTQEQLDALQNQGWGPMGAFDDAMGRRGGMGEFAGPMRGHHGGGDFYGGFGDDDDWDDWDDWGDRGGHDNRSGRGGPDDHDDHDDRDGSDD